MEQNREEVGVVTGGGEDQQKGRYSKLELEEFQEIILEKLKKAHVDLKLLTEAFTNHDEHDTNDTSPTFKVLEEGNSVLSKEENSRLAARQQKFISNLENALIRIENGTYGICCVTGNRIPKPRLRSCPHTTHSVEAKNQRDEKKSKGYYRFQN